MRRSTERILTTHTGSLPRPPELIEELYAKERGEVADTAAFEQHVRDAVEGVVRKQRSIGVDVVNDGEASKTFYATYIRDRLSGFGGSSDNTTAGGGSSDQREFPEWLERRAATMRSSTYTSRRPVCDGPIRYENLHALQQDLENFRAALNANPAPDAFLTAASPGVVAVFCENKFYPDHESYMFAVADAMKTEYDAIAKAGFVLQLDCPDLAMGRHSKWADLSLEEFRKIAQINVNALNHAVRDIPAEQMRIHMCWGNYEGPHHHDVPIASMLDIVLQAKPAGLSFEASNPRHEHEWKVWKDRKLPDGKVLIPGVLDSTTNFIEHPELVSQRITNFASAVGRENVIAGTDCGFSTAAGAATVVPSITWAKFQAMVDGAELASKELWGR